MGQFKFEILALGGHGCQREKGDGDFVIGCEASHCPDCITREYVRRLKRSGCSVEVAELTHLPGSSTEVRDNLLSGRRTGKFPEHERYQQRR